MRRIKLLTLSAATALCASGALAADFSFTGTFTNDNDVQLFDFTVGASSTVTLRTYSYAGGTMADGTVIAAGGFDPILALFDATTGALIEENDDDTTGTVAVDAATGMAWDTFLSATLAAGDYTVAVMQYDNFAAGNMLSNGFTYDGGPTNFTSNDCANGIFCDVSAVAPGNNRENYWAFDVLNVAEATIPGGGNGGVGAVPLPAGMPLLLAGLGGLALMRRRA